jgi:hypothetical protein
MTVPSNLNSTRFSSIAPTKATEKPASNGSSAATSGSGSAQAKGSASQPQPSVPAGLVGHHVNTTA